MVWETFDNDVERQVVAKIEKKGGRAIVGPFRSWFTHPDGKVQYETYTSRGIVAEGQSKPFDFGTPTAAADALRYEILKRFESGQILVWRRMPRTETDGIGFRATARLAFARDIPGVTSFPDE